MKIQLTLVIPLILAACGEETGTTTPGGTPSTVDLCADVVCEPEVACREAGICNPDTGRCEIADKREGSSCDDGNACTYGDHCESGSCITGGDVVCRPLDQCHDAGVCDPASGCSNPVKADDSACGDNDACTKNDRCLAGTCVGDDLVCTAVDACHLAGQCNPGTGQCTTPPRRDGESCNTGSGNLCLIGACIDGDCVATPIDCQPIDDCHEGGTCDPSTGTCSAPAKQDSSPCEDGDLCTENDNCQAGSCVTGTPVTCAALDQCHDAGFCDSRTGCTNPVKSDGSSCNDGNGCTLTDVCLAGGCRGSNPKACAPLDECHVTGVCDPTSGDCTNPPIEDGVVCDDADACTLSTTCQKGQCKDGTDIVCQPLDTCHVAGICDSVTGCSNPNATDGKGCEDGNPCSISDACVQGMCAPGRPKNCDATDQCTVDGVCDPSTGNCSVPHRANGSPCDDSNLCTLGDACQGGNCFGTTSVVCADPCLKNDEACEPSTGRCVGTPEDDGATCDDGDPCTLTEDCQGGVCLASASKTCDPEPTCYDAGFCDPASGACTKPAPFAGTDCEDGPCFNEETLSLGITWHNGDASTYGVGAGAAFIDFDQDGWLDIALAGEGGGFALYRNHQGTSFEDRTVAAGLPDDVPVDIAMGLAVADYDNDGHPDIYLLTSTSNQMFRNNGNGTFSDVTASAGLSKSAWSVAASFADFDRDGDLDLYVGNYIAAPGAPGPTGQPNDLFVNNGDGTFTEDALSYKIAGSTATLSVLWADYDADGWMDLISCNDYTATAGSSLVLRNDGANQPAADAWFEDVTSTLGFDAAAYCQAIAAGDYDGDMQMEFYLAGVGSNLLIDDSGSGYANGSVAAGVEMGTDACTSQSISSWGAAFIDIDNDCDLDLYVANGQKIDADAPLNTPYPPNALFTQPGKATLFDNVGLSSKLGDPRTARGVATGDYDGDGDLDILLANLGGAPVLYKNVTIQTNGWLQIAPVGRMSNRSGIGVRAEVTAGSCSLASELSPTTFASSSAGMLHFGLGSAAEVDSLVVYWPTGSSSGSPPTVVQHIYHVPADTLAVLAEPLVTVQSAAAPGTSVQAGDILNVDVVLVNHGGSAVDANVVLDVWLGGAPAFSSDGALMQVAAGSTASDVVGVIVPTGLVGASATAVQVIVTASDAGGGVDQATDTATIYE